jgi:tRNA pseudouridine13 synthase
MSMDNGITLNASDLKREIIQPPFITERLPGIGGVLKAIPEHFLVEEALPYAPCGEGEHVFVKLRRAGWNTADAAAALGRVFGLKGADIGWGGRKDKNAVTIQTFSLRLPMELPLAQVEDRIKPLPFEIIAIQRHGNKLKTGHVAANRFRIVLSGVKPSAFQQAEAIAAALKDIGVPNYYGGQRFGYDFRNLDRAVALAKRGKAHGKKDSFMVSVLQSALYNCWLVERIRRGEFDRLLRGDVVRKTDTGGLFVVDDLEEAARRFTARQITYTGPIFGYKMMVAVGPAGDYENQLLRRFGLDPGIFKPLRSPGSRRAAILYLNDLVVKPVAEGLEFAFTLPSGAYATTVLREFTRSSGDTVPEN